MDLVFACAYSVIALGLFAIINRVINQRINRKLEENK